MIAVVKHEIPSRFSIFIVNAPMRKSVKVQMVNPNNWLAGQINCLVSVRSAALGWNGLNTIIRLKTFWYKIEHFGQGIQEWTK